MLNIFFSPLNDSSILLQHDIDKLVNWSKKWNMEYNEGKCKVMNIGVQKETVHMLSIDNSLGERVNLQ